MLFDLDEMRKSHAKIQSHPLLGVLLAEAAQGVKEGGCAGRAQLGAKTAGARVHRGHIEDPLVVRLHQAGSAGEQAMPGSQGDLEIHQVVRPNKGRREESREGRTEPRPPPQPTRWVTVRETSPRSEGALRTLATGSQAPQVWLGCRTRECGARAEEETPQEEK